MIEEHRDRTLTFDLGYRVGVYAAQSNLELREFISFAASDNFRGLVQALLAQAWHTALESARLKVELQEELQSLLADLSIAKLALKRAGNQDGDGLFDLDSLRQQNADLRSDINELEKQLARLQGKADHLEKTLSWKLTKPLRVVGAFVGGKKKV